ncbi:hypothetical protein [Marivita sp. S0852]|uniref:hypothetical protein n=1 Tax=Marivita sp. S0852 TaxID=3373893 RepID=UPI003981B40F
MSSPSEWTRQLDRLSRHAMGQRSFMNGFQKMTGCSNAERNEILLEKMDRARHVLSVHMTATGKKREL